MLEQKWKESSRQADRHCGVDDLLVQITVIRLLVAQLSCNYLYIFFCCFTMDWCCDAR